MIQQKDGALMQNHSQIETMTSVTLKNSFPPGMKIIETQIQATKFICILKE
jgi:hypothetical protein